MARLLRLPRLILLIAALGAVALGAMLRSIAREVGQPVALDQVKYAQSTTCVMCHPSHYETWHQTYHRTMTQLAGPTAILGDFENASYTYGGVTSRFTHDGQHYFIETLSSEGRMQRFEVGLTVGSRRIQQYVTHIGDRNFRLPLAWDIEGRRWIHLNGGFLDPDGGDFNMHLSVWNANCIFCHNVKAQPGYDFQAKTFDSRVAELGVACEACHGPAAEHIARNSNPLRRYFLYLGDRDPTLVSPKELPVKAQTQLCGHCHGQRVPNPLDRIQQFMSVGDPYTAGDDLSTYTSPLFMDSQLQGVDLTKRFWRDGTPRLTAYEYQGLLLSAGHEKSELTCISCHSMHGGDPKGMITVEMRGSQACLQCHSEIGRDIPAHTKHLAASSGSDCYACHMPKIVYGILDMHPTHRIQNPDPARAWRFEMPEACTTCHTNRTAPWAAQAMSAQYSLPLPADTPAGAPFAVAEPIRALLSGDAVQRAAAISALTDEAGYTQDPIARLWATPFLLIAMDDNYPAIRHFSFRGLGRLIERAARQDRALGAATAALPPFDYLGPEPERVAAVAAWREWWHALDKRAIPHPGPAVPLDQSLQPIPSIVDPLLAARQNAAISIGE